MAEKVEAEFMKFSSSRSNDVAMFLKELARSRINWRSASAEFRTSLHPLEMKENALFVEAEDGGGVRGSEVSFRLIMPNIEYNAVDSRVFDLE